MTEASRTSRKVAPYAQFIADLASHVELRSTVESVVEDCLNARDLDESIDLQATKMLRTADVLDRPLMVLRFVTRPARHRSDSDIPYYMVVTVIRRDTQETVKFASHYPSVMRFLLKHKEDLPLPAIVSYRRVGRDGGRFVMRLDSQESGVGS